MPNSKRIFALSCRKFCNSQQTITWPLPVEHFQPGATFSTGADFEAFGGGVVDNGRVGFVWHALLRKALTAKDARYAKERREKKKFCVKSVHGGWFVVKASGTVQ